MIAVAAEIPLQMIAYVIYCLPKYPENGPFLLARFFVALLPEIVPISVPREIKISFFHQEAWVTWCQSV